MIYNKYSMIVAADEDWCIGKCGQLLDRFEEDMRFFRSVTNNKVVIMGDNTSKSLPNGQYLKNRLNIILDNSKTSIRSVNCNDDTNTTLAVYVPEIDFIPFLIKQFNDVTLNLNKYPNFNYMTDSDVFVIGGGQIYRYFLENDLIDTIYLTKIHHKYGGDTYIPNLYELGFREVEKISPEFINKNEVKYEIVKMKKCD